MTTKRTYGCNLCSSAIKDVGHDDRGYLEGIGLYFQSSPNPPIKFTRCGDAENHVCLACVVALNGYKK